MRRFFVLLTAFWLAAQGTAFAQAKSEFPTPGKTVNIIVPFAAGGPTDVAARLLVPSLEKELGTTVTVLNKPGASTQIGLTEVARAKPDGYTMGFVSLPQTTTIYLDPDRKAVFARKDFQTLAMHVVDPIVVAVRSDSPFKTMQELIDHAKANPGKLKAGTGGFMGTPHLAFVQIDRQTGARFALVHFDGSAPGITALLGGHIDLLGGNVSSVFDRFKSGGFRVLGIMDKAENEFLPGVKTLKDQGLDLDFASSRGLVTPAGTPKNIIETLAGALRKTMIDPDHVKKMSDLGQSVRYMDPAEFASYWNAADEQVKPLLEQAKAAAAK